jgi:hypothetical protein
MDQQAIHNAAGHMERLLAACGFGVFMACVFIVLIFVVSRGQAGRGMVMIIALYVLFFCIAMSMWAQGIRIGHIDPQIVKYGGYIAAAVMFIRALQGIIQRADPAALTAISGIIIGGGALGVLSIWGEPRSMLMVALILFVVGLIVFSIIAAWVLDRHDERKLQTQILLDRGRTIERLPYEEPKKLINNGRNLPALRKENQ